MFTVEDLETTWKLISEFERTHFGVKFGSDFAEIAGRLGQTKRFMDLGGIGLVMAALEASSLQKDLSADSRAAADRIMTRVNSIHHMLAEVFYVGYLVGRKDYEVAALGRMMNPDDASI